MPTYIHGCVHKDTRKRRHTDADARMHRHRYTGTDTDTQRHKHGHRHRRTNRHRHGHIHTWDATVEVERGLFDGTVTQKKLWGGMTDCPGTPDSPIRIHGYYEYI